MIRISTFRGSPTKISSADINDVVQIFTSELDLHCIQMAALSRHFHLGQFYNYVSDEMVTDTEMNLQWQRWGESLEYTAQEDVKFELSVTRSDSRLNKWEQMDLDEHLKASTVAGLIEDYRGASIYLEIERPNSIFEATQLIHFKVKSKSQRINPYCWINMWRIVGDENQVHLKSFQLSQLQSLEITHVVVGVHSGAEGYCVLTQVFDDKKENRSLVERQLSCVAKLIEDALKDQKDLDLFKEHFDEKTKKQLERIKCRLYVDCQTPICHEYSVFDAYEQCIQVIEQVKKIENNSVPIAVTLCPIDVLMRSIEHFKAPLKNPSIPDIDSRVYLVDRCCKMWSDLDMLLVKVEVLQDAANDDRGDHLKRFSSVLKGLMARFRAKLKNGITVMRMGFRSFDFQNVLDIEEKHFLFGVTRLNEWLEFKKKEQEIERKWTKLNGIHFFPDKCQLQQELARATDGNSAFVLSIPLLHEQTGYILEQMEKYDKSYNGLMRRPSDILTREIYASNNGVDMEALNNLPWYMDNKRILPVTRAICEMLNHVQTNRRNHCRVKFFLTLNSEISDSNFGYSVYQPGEFVSFRNLQHLPGSPLHIRVRRLQQNRLSPSHEKTANRILVRWSCQKRIELSCRYVVQHRYKEEPYSP